MVGQGEGEGQLHGEGEGEGAQEDDGAGSNPEKMKFTSFSAHDATELLRSTRQRKDASVYCIVGICYACEKVCEGCA